MSSLTYQVKNGYIQLPVTTDPATIQAKALAAIAAALPGWIPRESHIEVLLLEQFAAMVAESAQVAANVPLAIFSYFGSLVGITPKQGSPAKATTTWTMTDSKGYTIPSGTIVGYQVLGNKLYTFQTTSAFTVPTGTTQAHSIPIESTVFGETYNGLAAQTLTLVVPALSFVSSVASTNTTAGGSTPETTTAYLNRLAEELQLLTPRPILSNDYAELAKNIASVYRAACFNLVNPYANQLLTEDADFNGGLGTWKAVSGCTLAYAATGPSGEHAMEITATGTTNAVAQTNPYNMPGTVSGHALVTFDHPTTSRNCYVGIEFLDASTAVISTTNGTPIAVQTAGLTFAEVKFTSPPTSHKCRVQVTVETPVATTHQYVAFPALVTHPGLPNPTNYVPDSNMTVVSTAKTWTLAAGMKTDIYGYVANLYPAQSQQFGIVYTGTNAASGTLVATSEWFYLPAGTYAASASILARFVTAGAPSFSVNKTTGAALLSMTQTAGATGILDGSFTLTTPEVVRFEFSTANCTVQTAEPLTFALPQVINGTYVSYSAGDEWTPPGKIYNNPRMVTVSAVDVNGNALTSTENFALNQYLQSMREVNFIVNVIGPTYTQVDVSYVAHARTGYNANTVTTTCNNLLKTYLSPATWGGGKTTPPEWNPNDTVVRYLSIVSLLGDADGVTYLSTVKIGYHGAALGTSDVTLLGFAPLPKSGTITGLVHPYSS